MSANLDQANKLLLLLSELSNTVASLHNFERDFDDRLKEGITQILISFRAVGIVTTISEDAVQYSCLAPLYTFNDAVLGAMEKLEGQLEQEILYGNTQFLDRSSAFPVSEFFTAILMPKDLRRRTETGTEDERWLGREIVAVLFKAPQISLDQATNEPRPDYFRDALLIATDWVMMMLRRRCDIFSRFPNNVSHMYWQLSPNTLRKMRGRRCEILGKPPWSLKSGRPVTVTLAADLCRSTEAMNGSPDGKAKDYADWLEELMLILQRIAHKNFGVFDKFTGDGIIAHFISRDIELLEDYDEKLDDHHVEGIDSHPVKAVDAAIKASVEMMEAMDLHLLKLKNFVNHWSEHYGLKIGIAVGAATWSVSRNGEPIVVGKGVVDACRLFDVASTAEILISNAVLQCANSDRQTDSEVPCSSRQLKGKGFPKENKNIAYVIERGMLPEEFTSPNKAKEIVDEIYDETDRRKRPFLR